MHFVLHSVSKYSVIHTTRSVSARLREFAEIAQTGNRKMSGSISIFELGDFSASCANRLKRQKSGFPLDSRKFGNPHFMSSLFSFVPFARSKCFDGWRDSLVALSCILVRRCAPARCTAACGTECGGKGSIRRSPTTWPISRLMSFRIESRMLHCYVSSSRIA